MSGYRYVGGTYINKKLDIHLERGDRLTEQEVKQLPENIRERCREDDLATTGQGLDDIREQVYKMQDTVANLSEQKQQTEKENANLKAKLAELEDEAPSENGTAGDGEETKDDADGEESQVDDAGDGAAEAEDYPIKKNGGWYEFSNGDKKQMSPEEAEAEESKLKKKV